MRAAIVGVGFMGWIHYLAYQRSTHADLVAFCSRNPAKRAGDWTSIQGNFGPPAEKIDVTDLRVYETLEQVLQDESVDLVDICLPPHLHVDAVSKSLQAGKAVLCEKPLALTGAEAGKLTASAPPGKLMVAHILPFMPEFAYTAEAAADGRFGKAIGGSFTRIIGPPDWIPDFYDPQAVGGPLVDLHVHDAHLIRMLFGMPEQVFTRGRMKGETAKYFETTFRMSDPEVVVSARSGVIDQAGRPFTHGYEVQFERATIRFEFAGYADGTTSEIPLVVMHQDGSVERPTTGDAEPTQSFLHEIDAVAKAVDDGEVHPALDGSIAADALLMCDAQLRSLREAQPVHVASPH